MAASLRLRGLVLDTGQWQIPGGTLQPRDLILPGDWSGAAAFLAAAAVTERLLLVGPLDPDDAQGDRAMVAILEAAGCAVRWIDAQTLEVRAPSGAAWMRT